MDKDKLRSVEFRAAFNSEGLVKDEKYLGYFHGYSNYRDEDSANTYAIIELEDGQITETYVTYVKFIDRN